MRTKVLADSLVHTLDQRLQLKKTKNTQALRLHAGRHQRRPKKPVPHIQRIAAEAQSKKVMRLRLDDTQENDCLADCQILTLVLRQAAQQAARDEALRLVREREAQRQRAMQRRKQQHASFRKKTKTGQPVMSVRIHKILGQLQTAA